MNIMAVIDSPQGMLGDTGALMSQVLWETTSFSVSERNSRFRNRRCLAATVAGMDGGASMKRIDTIRHPHTHGLARVGDDADARRQPCAWGLARPAS